MKQHNFGNRMPYCFAVIIAAYTMSGHFIGKEFSPVAGFLTTPIGLLAGFLIAKRTENRSFFPRTMAAVLPLLVLALVLVFGNKNFNPSELNGAWTASADSQEFTLLVKNNSALLSVEPGLKNVEYQVEIKGDSLLLIADKDNRLALHITSSTKNQLTLDAGGVMFFTKRHH
jgi:hypothetical protein